MVRDSQRPLQLQHCHRVGRTFTDLAHLFRSASNQLFWVDLALCPSSSLRLDAPGHKRELVPWSQIECKMGLSSPIKRDEPNITLVLPLSLKDSASEAINTMVWTSLFGVRPNIPTGCRNVGKSTVGSASIETALSASVALTITHRKLRKLCASLASHVCLSHRIE